MTTQNLEFNFQNEETSTIDVIYEVLEKNNLTPSPEEWLKEYEEKEPRSLIVRNAALTLFGKRISEEKLAEILEKHLEISDEKAMALIGDIKTKLVPFIKDASPLSTQPTTQEILLEKIKEKAPYVPETKKVEIKSVEENAEELKKQRENQVPIKQNTVGQEIRRSGQDKYRESVD